jgi:hypothetical protein
MIVYMNLTGQRVKADDVIEAVEMAQGHPISGKFEMNSRLDIIKLKHGRNGRAPITVKGYQDTRITANDDGTMTVEHGAPGMGCLRFEADRYMNRIARVARTEHNINMLIRASRDGQWTLVDPQVADEIQLAHNKWWKALGEHEKTEILENEKRAKLTPHQVPSGWTQRSNPETAKLIKELADQSEANRLLMENNKALEERLKAIELDKVRKDVVEAEKTELMKPYAEMTPFELHAVLRGRKIEIDRKWPKKFLLELVTSADPETLIREAGQ